MSSPTPSFPETPSGIGRSVRRSEDLALLTGRARFIDDLNITGQVHAAFVRSPHAHATILGMDPSAAMASDDVIGVFSAEDLLNDGVGAMRTALPLKSRDGTGILTPSQLALAHEQVRFVGDPVAVVIANSPSAALSGAELVEVDYEPHECIVDPIRALEPSATRVWPRFDTNVALDWSTGDHEGAQTAFESAAHRVTVEIVNNRVVVAAMEPRGALAEFDSATGRFTIWTPTQGGTPVQLGIADALAIAPSSLRVVTPEVGGGFGIKNGVYPEQIVVTWLARRLGTPVKWYASRAESFLTDYHARDHAMRAELALDADGRFLAIRSHLVSNMGAYLTGAAPVIPTAGGTRMLSNVYRIPTIAASAQCVFTHTVPIAAYRGAGKPEYAHLVECLIDRAAEELGFDRIELRRLNLIQPQDLPWKTSTGLEYDSGDFPAVLDEALRRAVKPPPASSVTALRGRGISVYTEPDGFKDNRVELSFDPAGSLNVTTSGQPNGQGHRTVFAQIANSLLGVPFDAIQVTQGDTDKTGFASGTGGSRTTTVTGSAMHYAALDIIEKSKRLAGHLLEANAEDIEFDIHAGNGRFAIAGTDRVVGWREVAKLAHSIGQLPSDLPPGLDATHHYDAPVYCYPSGCHVCDIEIDSETGQLSIVGYFSLSDFGTIVNPMLLEGQLHGGIAQGIGQAAFEHTAYDATSGQLLAGSFMDYCVPRASQLPWFETHTSNIACLTNPLGVKGCGESGPTAALPAVMSAVWDALTDYDTTSLQMPFTAERIWRVIQRGPKG
jgi:carbon-monoxide dehydrogenase large subunit